jgi:hypothetical protein
MRLQQDVGFGHRFSDVLMGVAIAQKIDCQFIWPDLTREFATKGEHGGYAWATPFFNLPPPTSKQDAEHGLQRSPMTYPIASAEWRCGKLLMGTDTMCIGQHNKWCGCINGLFEDVKWQFRERFWKQHGERDKGFEIVQHIRVGDIHLDAGNRQLYERVLTLLSDLLRGTGVARNMTFVFECVECAGRPPRGYEFIDGICRAHEFACTFEGSLDARDSMVAMVFADLLITSGSSFADIAAFYSRGVVILHDSKDGFNNSYWLNEHFRMHPDGSIMASVNEIRGRVHILLNAHGVAVE